MKNLKEIIHEKLRTKSSFMIEKLKINSKSKINTSKSFTDKELMNDYDNLCHDEANSQKYADKYNVATNDIYDIQTVILNYLRDNRKYKKEFNSDDYENFLNYGYTTDYKEYKKYLDQESKDFLKFVLNEAKKDLDKYNNWSHKNILVKKYETIVSQIKKYLNIS